MAWGINVSYRTISLHVRHSVFVRLTGTAFRFDLRSKQELNADPAIDVLQYSLNTTRNVNSTFRGRQIDAPTLNITAAWFDDKTLVGAVDSTPDGPEKMLWVWSNETYNYNYITRNGTCQASGVRKLFQIGWLSDC